MDKSMGSESQLSVVAGVAISVLTPVLAKMLFGRPRRLHIDGVRWLIGTIEAVEVNVAVTCIDAGDLDGVSRLGVVVVDGNGEFSDVVDGWFA